MQSVSLKIKVEASRRCFCLGVSARLNGVEKLDVDIPNTPEN